MSFFWVGHFEFFFSKKKKKILLHSHENQPKLIWQNGWVKILMFSLVSRKFLAMRNIALYSVNETNQYCNISHFCRYCLELVSREWNIAFLTSRIDWLKKMKWKKEGKKKFVKTFLAKHTYYVRISWSTKFNISSEIYI